MAPLRLTGRELVVRVFLLVRGFFLLGLLSPKGSHVFRFVLPHLGNNFCFQGQPSLAYITNETFSRDLQISPAEILGLSRSIARLFSWRYKIHLFLGRGTCSVSSISSSSAGNPFVFEQEAALANEMSVEAFQNKTV